MSIQSVLDDNKTVIPEGDYLRCSNELRDMYATTNDFYKLTYIFTKIHIHIRIHLHIHLHM